MRESAGEELVLGKAFRARLERVGSDVTGSVRGCERKKRDL